MHGALIIIRTVYLRYLGPTFKYDGKPFERTLPLSCWPPFSQAAHYLVFAVLSSVAAFEKVVHYRGQEFLTKLVDTAGQVGMLMRGSEF